MCNPVTLFPACVLLSLSRFFVEATLASHQQVFLPGETHAGKHGQVDDKSVLAAARNICRAICAAAGVSFCVESFFSDPGGCAYSEVMDPES